MNLSEIKRKLEIGLPEGLLIPEHTEDSHFYRNTKENKVYASVSTKCGILDSPHLKKWASTLSVDCLLKNITPEILQQNDEVVMEKLRLQAILAPQDYFEEAGDIGTRCHKVIESYEKEWIKTGIRPENITSFIKDDNDSRVYATTRSAQMFCDDFELIPLMAELIVCSVRHKYAGTLDLLALVFNATHKGNSGICKPREHVYLNGNKGEVECMKCGREGKIELAIVDWKTSNSIDKNEYAMQVAAYWRALKEMTGLNVKKIYLVRLDKKIAKYEFRILEKPVKAFAAFFKLASVYDWLMNDEGKLVNINKKEAITLNANGNPTGDTDLI